jgi:hypothetical protein
MIAYADNKYANYLHNIIKKNYIKKNYIKKYNKNNYVIIKKKNLNLFFENLLEKSLNNENNNKIKISSIMEIYWKIGTHYYLPLSNKYINRNDFIKKAQHPYKNLFVIGEMVALDQGWTNGALKSVENIKDEL